MLKRVISGTVITVIAGIVLFIGDWLLGLTLLGLSVIAFRELNRAMDKTERLKINPLEFIGMIAIIVLLLFAFYR
jgi:CDP-diglyceride synthetase